MMSDQTEWISAAVYEDEVMDYLAERYHTSPREIIRSFFAQEERTAKGVNLDNENRSWCLEENEVAILRDLITARRHEDQALPRRSNPVGRRRAR